MSDELEKVLRRWEGAVYATERDGDDSDEALKELEDSRRCLLELLRRALPLLNSHPRTTSFGHIGGGKHSGI